MLAISFTPQWHKGRVAQSWRRLRVLEKRRTGQEPYRRHHPLFLPAIDMWRGFCDCRVCGGVVVVGSLWSDEDDEVVEARTLLSEARHVTLALALFRNINPSSTFPMVSSPPASSRHNLASCPPFHTHDGFSRESLPMGSPRRPRLWSRPSFHIRRQRRNARRHLRPSFRSQGDCDE